MNGTSPHNLEPLIRLFDRQKVFDGDLNLAQRIALMWLMGNEAEEAAELEKVKFQNMALAVHPTTQSDYLKSLFEVTDEINDVPEEFEEENIGIEWRTPESEEELAELERILELEGI